ncbi:MAG TPA: PEP-CTERM sorting domain-containing protein [Bryobacteraceae bacterium]|jgi:hypothetical protein
MRNKIVLTILAAMMPAVLSAGTLTLSVTTSIPSADDYLIYMGCTVSIGSCTPATPGDSANVAFLAAALPAGTVHPDPTATIPDSVLSGYVTAIGLATPSDVVIALGNGISITSSTWASLFTTPEGQIAADLLGGSTAQRADLLSFFQQNYTDFIPLNGTGGNIGEFSTGVVVGTLGATVSAGAGTVPEPGTLALTGALLGGLALLRRRRLSRSL